MTCYISILIGFLVLESVHSFKRDAKDISVVVSTLQDPRPPAWSKAISPSFKEYDKRLKTFRGVRQINEKLNEAKGDVYGLQANFKSAILQEIDVKQSKAVDLKLTTLPSGEGILRFGGHPSRGGWTLLEIKATVIKPLD